MKTTLEEAKAALAKSKDDMTRYYNQKRVRAPEFNLGDQVYLDASDISSSYHAVSNGPGSSQGPIVI